MKWLNVLYSGILYTCFISKLIEIVKARFLLVFALLLVHPSVSAQGVSTPTSAPMRESKINPATTTPTSTREKINKIGELATDLEQLDKSFTIIIFFVAKVLAGFLSILVIYRIILLIVNRPFQLIIDNFNNATGTAEMDRVLPGLSQLARQTLIEEMNNVHQQIKQHRMSLEAANSHLKNKLPLPKTIPDQRLTDLIASLKKFTPDQLDSTVQLLNVMFPPRGTKVASILQSQGNEHHKLGITFEISDLQGNAASKIRTIWEPEKDNLSEQDLKDRYRELLKPAIRWLAIELSRREMVITTSSNKQGKADEAQVQDFYNYTLELERLHDENVKHDIKAAKTRSMTQ